MDVKILFLHGDMKEDIYMALRDDVEVYNGQLLKMGFARLCQDYCLYTRCTPGDELVIIIYVDDLLGQKGTLRFDRLRQSELYPGHKVGVQA